MKKLKLFFSVLMLLFVGIGQVWATDVVDELKASMFTATNTTYKDFSSVSATSDAFYAGNSGKTSSGGIQMRSKNSNSGIVSTTSGGTVKSVKITVESGSNTIDIYGSNTAYTAASDLYDSSKQGTKVGSVSATGTVTFTDEYAYVGIRSNNGAIYVTSVEITWTTGGSNNPTVSTSPTSLTFDAVEEGGSAPSAKTFTITGSYLTSALSIASSNTSLYTCAVTTGSLTPTNKAVSATVTVTPQAAITASAGTKEANITISGGGLSSNVNVALSTTVTVPAHSYTYTHDFTQISGFSNWGSSYAEHIVNYDILPATPDGNNDDQVVFASANKQSSTITDRPVTKGGDVELKLLNNTKYLSAVKFVCKQWNSNTQTITLHYSTDGGTTYSTFNPSITATNYEIENTSLPAKTNAVKISFSKSGNNSQVGISSVSFDLVDKVSYNINKSETGCTLSVTNGTSAITTAEAGDEVYVSIASTTTGYENASFEVKDADNNDVAFANGKFTMPAKNVTITATATKKQYTVTLAATNGKIQVGGADKTSISVAHGETAELTAVANNDYAFSSWATSDGTKVSLSSTTNNPATITVTGAATITATFVSTAKLNPGFAWSAASAEAVKGQAASLPTITTNPYSLTPTYVSTNTDVAEISSAGVVSIKGVGSTTIKATYAEDATYSAYEASYTLTVKGRVTWHAKKSGVDATTTADYTKDAVPAKPTGDFITSCHSSISLVGWTTATYKNYSDDNDAPAVLYTANENMPAVTDNVDYYAVWAVAEEDDWAETTLSNISSTDIVVIAGYDGEDYYGIKASGTSSSPVAIEITVEDGKITSAFDDENNNIKWNIIGNATDGYSFYVNGGTADDRLYCSTAANSGSNSSWRVGNPASGNNRYTLEWSATKNTMVTKDNSTARYLCLYNGTDWRSYVVGSVTTTNLTFFKYTAGATTGYTTNCVEPLSVATPTFTPDGNAAYYTEAQDVEISCVTENSTIYYTTDGTDPDNESTEYTGAIIISETTTIKAIAYVGNVASEVAEATFTINMPITTIQKLFEEATAIGTSAQKRMITFGNWIVSGIGSDNKSVYVTDNTKGFVIYGSDHGFAVGNVLSGTVECDLQLYSGFAEIKGLKASNANLTVTTGGTLVPAAAAIKDLGAINTGAPVILSNVTYDSDGDLVDDESYYVKPDNMLYSDAVSTFEESKIYNVTGVYVYASKDKIAPRNADDIVKLSKEQQTITWYVDNTKAEAIGTSYSLDSKDDDFAPICESNSTGAKTYQSSDPSVATIHQTTGVIEVIGNGVTTITCSVAGDDDYVDGSKAFTLKVGIGEATWVAKDWAESESISSNTNLSGDYATIAADANVNMTWSKGTGSNVPIYHNSDKEARLYQNDTLTFTASNSKQITSIVFHFTSGHAGTFTANEGTYNGTSKEWTGFTHSVIFTNTGSAAYIKSIDIEYASGTTTTLEIEDIELSMLSPAAQDIVYTCNKANPVIVYSDYDDEVISIANGKITPLAVGNTTVKASIAAEAPYSSVSKTFNVIVRSGTEVIDEVVLYAEYDGDYYALNNEAGATEIDICGGKVVVSNEATKNAIVWKRTVSDGVATFYNEAVAKYLTTGSSNAMAVGASANWTWNEAGYYSKTSGRTFIYRESASGFKDYSAGNAGTDDYADYTIIHTGEVVIGTIEVIRDGLEEGKWGTYCPVNGLKAVEGASFYTITYVEKHSNVPYKVFFDEIEGGSLTAGQPYVFIAEGEEIKGVKDNTVASEGQHNDHGFIGYTNTENDDAYTFNVSQDDVDAHKYYVIKDNAIRRCGEGWFGIKSERAFINMSGVKTDKVAAAPGRRRVSLSNPDAAPQVATGIDELNESSNAVKVVINAQLFIIRNGRLYDTTGRFVEEIQ